MASNAARSMLDPGDAVVRILLPDNAGFLTVAWSREKDAVDNKVPLARDLMKKVLTSYSKRLSGLTEMETDFQKRAALDFAESPRTRDSSGTTVTTSTSTSTGTSATATTTTATTASSTVTSYDRALLEIYQFVLVRGTKRIVFKTQQPLITLFNEGGDGRKPKQLVTLGLWRSNAKKPRRR